MEITDVIIIGASAAGLMCAIEAGKRGRRVMVLDHARKAGNKIRMSGGGYCNFTNYSITPDDYICHNPHFCKSALSRYTQWDFLSLVQRHQIPYHEKSHGQLFCDHDAKDILDMLLAECDAAAVTIRLNTKIEKIEKLADRHFRLNSSRGDYHCQSLVIASGGLSIPTMGASPFGYQIAGQFGIPVWPTSPGLVPFTLQHKDRDTLSKLSGVAVDSIVSNQRQHFRENILFTHRGLSGPAILQISSYWRPGEEIMINLLPDIDISKELHTLRQQHPRQRLKTALTHYLPRRLVASLLDNEQIELPLHALSHAQIKGIARQLKHWSIRPNGTEGYRTAEVTLGGVDCDAVSSKTMECHQVPGLYFVGEVLDVAGRLGGYNLQWAWSSGWCAGQYV